MRSQQESSTVVYSDIILSAYFLTSGYFLYRTMNENKPPAQQPMEDQGNSRLEQEPRYTVPTVLWILAPCALGHLDIVILAC